MTIEHFIIELDLPSVLVFLCMLILEEPTKIWTQDVKNFKISKSVQEQITFLFVQGISINLRRVKMISVIHMHPRDENVFSRRPLINLYLRCSAGIQEPSNDYRSNKSEKLIGNSEKLECGSANNQEPSNDYRNNKSGRSRGSYHMDSSKGRFNGRNFSRDSGQNGDYKRTRGN